VRFSLGCRYRKLFIDCSKRDDGVGFPFEEETGGGFSSAIAYKTLKKERKKIEKNKKPRTTNREIKTREKRNRALHSKSSDTILPLMKMNIPCLMWCFNRAHIIARNCNKERKVMMNLNCRENKDAKKLLFTCILESKIHDVYIRKRLRPN